jgi:hypothetical protein
VAPPSRISLLGRALFNPAPRPTAELSTIARSSDFWDRHGIWSRRRQLSLRSAPEQSLYTTSRGPNMPRIKRIVTLAAISVATATSAPGIAGAVAIGPGVGSASTPNPDSVAAQRAATSMSAPLDRFGLLHVHTITLAPTSVVTGRSGPEGFQLGDFAIGAGAMAGVVLLGAAGAITVRRLARRVRSQVLTG